MGNFLDKLESDIQENNDKLINLSEQRVKIFLFNKLIDKKIDLATKKFISHDDSIRIEMIDDFIKELGVINYDKII